MNIILETNQTYTIELELNTSGHCWMVLENTGLDIQSLSMLATQPSDNPRIGKANNQLFKITSDKSGKYTLRLGLVRPWQPETIDKEHIYTFVFN